MSVSVGQVIDGELGKCGGKLGVLLEFETPLIEMCSCSGRRVRECGILQRFEMVEVEGG